MKFWACQKRQQKRTSKRAYRRLAFEYHPDRNPNDASAAKKFREATEAYNALADPRRF